MIRTSHGIWNAVIDAPDDVQTIFYDDCYWSGLPGLSKYLISAGGHIMSFTRRVPFIMRPSRVGKYQAVTLMGDDGQQKREYVHRLVLKACHRLPLRREQGCHFDGIPANNDIRNLRWDTAAGNHADKKRHGTDTSGERNAMARLTATEVAEMRDLYAGGGWTFKSLAQRYGVTTMSAHRAVRRQTWTK